MIDGKLIDLKPLDMKFADELRTARNSLEVLALSGSSDYAPVTDTEHERWLKELIDSGNSKYQFAIVEKTTGKAVGTIGFINFDNISRKAGLQLRIGPKTNWGKGFGTEAVSRLCRYGFTMLNLERIYLEVAKENVRAISVYNKIGFKEEGTLRKHAYTAGDFHDVLLMGLLKDEFTPEKTVEVS